MKISPHVSKTVSVVLITMAVLLLFYGQFYVSSIAAHCAIPPTRTDIEFWWAEYFSSPAGVLFAFSAVMATIFGVLASMEVELRIGGGDK